ncbi:MAG TPA: thiopurine S-methyltransferase [Woeseiaceae bacterium]|nr:thiopurine S-methyltransferase [Woeseiaceae bacterium]
MFESWLERWREGRIGWHEEGGNASLKKHWDAKGRRVLVPMCGKTADMLWLEEQGNSVVGVELSDIAVRAFFEENGLQYTVRDGRLPAYIAGDRDISIYCGDLFAFNEPGFTGWYDRGAFVAMPAEQRPAYADRINRLLADDACRLLITLEYDDSIATGPPFSISDEEIRRYWPDLRVVDRYDDIENGPPKFREAGLQEMFEIVWR